jgi:iron complex transport system ATP-binding protein
MLLRHGHIVAIGESDATLTTENVSNCFGFPVTVRREDGRWFARATGSWSASAE